MNDSLDSVSIVWLIRVVWAENSEGIDKGYVDVGQHNRFSLVE